MLNLERWALALILLISGICDAQTIGVSNWTSGTVGATTVTSGAVTTQATGSGFLCIPIYRLGAGATLPTSVVDSKSNTYVLENSLVYAFGQNEVGIYFANSGTGGSGHTCTASGWTTGADLLSVAFVELKGFGSLTLDVAPTGIQNTAGPPTLAPSITTTVANELVLDVFGTYGNNPQTITDTGTGFSIIVSQGTNGGINGGVSFRIPTSSGTAAADSFSYATFDYSGGLAISLKPAGASCTHNFWKSTGALTQPDGSTGSYWNCATGNFSTPNCSTGSFRRADGACAAN